MAGMGILNVAVTGLTAANRALTTVGHNILNVDTEGYSRQRVDIEARTPQLAGGSYVGSGVRVANTRRVFDAFATAQVRTSSSSAGYADTYYDLAQGLDNLLASSETGLTTPLQNFFNAAEDVASDPSSSSAREVMLAQGQTLANRFQTLDQALGDLDRRVGEGIAGTIEEINTSVAAIADLNQDILVARGRSGGAEPNDLLDQRDELLRQLAGKIGITVIEQDDGSVNVATGSGQSLVTGSRTATLVVLPGEDEPGRVEVGYRSGDHTANVTGLVGGGELGAFLTFRQEVLDEARDELGGLAKGVAETFNAQHRQGYGLDGVGERDFFVPLDASVPARRAAGEFGVAIGDGAQIAAAGSPGASGDNENALALSALRSARTLNGGTATYGDAYGALVAEVGTRTSQAEVNQAAQAALLDQATAARAAISGVSLDEEAAALMRYQQTYQACAQVIAAASLLFDTLIEAVAS